MGVILGRVNFLFSFEKLEKCFLQASQMALLQVVMMVLLLSQVMKRSYKIWAMMISWFFNYCWSWLATPMSFSFPMRWRKRWGTQLLVFGMFWLQCKLHQDYSKIWQCCNNFNELAFLVVPNPYHKNPCYIHMWVPYFFFISSYKLGLIFKF